MFVRGCTLDRNVFGAVTPPLKNVRKRRFRKTKIKKVSEVVLFPLPHGSQN